MRWKKASGISVVIEDLDVRPKTPFSKSTAQTTMTSSLWKEDKANLFVFWLTVIGFIFAIIGLAFLPVGEDAKYRTSLRFINPADNGGMDLLDMHLLVPYENLPLFWVGVIWPVLAGVLTIIGSTQKSTAVLLYGLLFVGISASLLLLCAHLLTVFTYNCRFCDADVYPDGVYDTTPGE
jgi:CHASE2 domain-containing sensor protein